MSVFGNNNLKLFYGNANPDLACGIANYLRIAPCAGTVTHFSDGETWVELADNVRGSDVFVVQPTCPPVNEHLMELLIIIDALKRSSADRITAVIPYYGYARQDRKVSPRTPITSKLVADLITAAGAHRVLTMDLHAGQIQGFFNIPVDHLFAKPVLLDYFRNEFGNNTVVVAPDAGGAERARAFAKLLDAPMALIDKRRPKPNVNEVVNIIGDVAGMRAVIVDDMIDTAGTLVKAAEALKAKGATEVHGCCVHAVLSGPALNRVQESCLESLITTDSIPLSAEAKACKKIKVLSVAKLLGEAIKRIHESDSVSSLFV